MLGQVAMPKRADIKRRRSFEEEGNDDTPFLDPKKETTFEIKPPSKEGDFI